MTLDQLSILTLNFGGIPGKDHVARVDYLAQKSRKLTPDILCGQELWQPLQAEIIGYYFKDNYSIYFSTRAEFSKGKPLLTQGGLVTAIKKECQLLENLQELPFQRFVTQLKFNVLCPKISVKQFFIDKLLGSKGFAEFTTGDLSLINTHLLASYRTPEIEKNLGEQHKDYGIEAQMIQLAEHVVQRKKEGKRVIVAGDLNVGRESPYLKILLDTGLYVLNPEIKEEKVLPEYKTQVDWVLCSDDFQSECSPTQFYSNELQKNATDHPGFLVKVNYTE